MSSESIARNLGRSVVLLLASSCLLAPAREAPDHSSLTNYDRRLAPAKIAAQPGQRLAQAKLQERVPDAVIDFDPVLGTPRWVQARSGFLTGAGGEGRAVTAATAKRFERDPNQALKSFLAEHEAVFRHGPEILDGAVPKRDHTNDFGLRTAVWEQQVNGIPVFDSVLVAHTSAKGELVSLSSQFVPRPDRAADRGTPKRAAQVQAPPLSADQALRRAAANVGEEAGDISPLGAKTAGPDRKQRFQIKPLPGEAGVQLVWLPLDGDTLRLCWQVELNRRAFGERFRLVLDAETGEVLVRRKLTVDASEVLYRVFTSDSPSPFSPGWPVPTNTQPPLVARQLVSISNVSATASPLGWINDGVLETRGNNVDAHLDRDGDDRADLPRVSATMNAGGQRVFDFPLDLSQHPTNYQAAATVQLFYWCNWAHDKLYELGFTEGTGNFQKDNFGRGGVDNDVMLAQAQDGSGVNNANFTPAPDGQPGKIQMFIFPGPSPARDGDLDAEVILHEYAHGLSDRLIGGGVGISQLQTFGLGEGWSDFYGEALLTEFTDDPGGNYAVGGYLTYQFSGLKQNYYYGIRRYPYTTNLDLNPLTFKDIDPTRASTHPGVPRNPIITSTASEVHRQGEVWCSMLWDMRANLLAKYAPTNAVEFTNANMRVLRYVTLGLQLSPPNPNFAQARDAILLATRNLSGSGDDTNEIWAAFARRGLGVSAICPDSSTTIGVTEAFDIPVRPEFDVQPHTPFTIVTGKTGGPFSPAAITNLLVNYGLTNLPWGVGASAPWLQLSSSNGVLSPSTSVEHVVSFSPVADALPVGNYQGIVFYTNLLRTQVVSRVVSLLVRSSKQDDLVVTPSTPLTLTGPVGGPFSPASQTYLLANEGNTPLDWRVFTTNEWLGLVPTNGTLSASNGFTNVTVTISTNAFTLANDVYYGAVSFENTNTGARIDAPVTLRVGRLDYLTEDFLPGQFDLHNTTITFTPDLSPQFYRVCREAAGQFPTDPAGGQVLALADDQYRQIGLTNGRQVSLFGNRTNAVFIGANGNVSFNPGPRTDFFYPGAAEHFAGSRVAALYADLNPEVGGTISYLQLSNRLVVTYDQVPEFGVANSNNLQIELLFDGAIRMTWLTVEATNNLHVVGLSRGEGLPVDYERSDLSADGNCLPLASLFVPARATEGEIVIGTILLNKSLTDDLLVTLATTDTNAVTIPVSILVPAGQLSVEFGIGVIDDGEIDGTQAATITARFPDRLPVSATILVDDYQSAALTLNVAASGQEGQILFGGGTVTASVTAIRPLAVSLLSEYPARVHVPATVIIPAGQSSASFDIVLTENTLLDGTQTVDIEASVANWVGDLDAIRVTDNESRALTLSFPPEVTEGQGKVVNGGRVSLGGRATSNIVISLQSEQPGLVSVPALVTNRSGQSGVSFDLMIGDNSIINNFDIVRILATAATFTWATGSVAVIDDERPFVPSNPFPADGETHVPRNTLLAWTVNSNAPATTLYDVYFGTNALLTINDLVSRATDLSAVLPSPLDPGVTYYWQVVAQLDPFDPVTSPVWQFTTTEIGFRIGPMSSPQFTGEPFEIAVYAQDEFGLAVTNYQGGVVLTNYAPVPSGASIVITEIDSGGFPRIEFANVSGQAINIAGWQIAVYDFVQWPAPSIVVSIPGPSVCATGELFFLRSLGLQFFPGRYPNFATGTNILWSNNTENNPVAVLLRDNFGTIVDFVCASGADPSLISLPALIPPEQWSGPPLFPNVDSLMTYQRQGGADSNRSNDWVIARRNTGTNNPGLSMPFASHVPVAFTATPLNSFNNEQGLCLGQITMLGQARAVTFGVRDEPGHGAAANPIDVFSRNDVALSVSAPDFALVNEAITYQFTITNVGPAAATGVTLLDTLGTNSAFFAAVPSQGACSFADGVVTCQLGDLTADTIVTVTVLAQSLTRGVVTNFASITRAEADAYPANNTVTSVTAAGFPQLSILDATNSEPNAGTVSMTFSLRLSAPNPLTSSVAFATTDNTALAGPDYLPVSGVVLFPPGVTNQTLSVLIQGDLLNEGNETFFVALSGATNLDITKNLATGTIKDNDPLPQITIGDVTVTEGNGGLVAAFPLQMNMPSGRSVSVNFSTANGTALAGLDYVESYGTVSFPAGQTSAVVNVSILNDAVPEPAKTFFLNGSSSVNAVFARSPGVGTILDPDPAGFDHFTFGPVTSITHAGTTVPIILSARDSKGAIVPALEEPVTLLALAEQNTVTIGSNSTTWGLPFSTSFHDARLQSIYLTNEVGPAARLTGLALDLTTAPGQTLSNWTIRLRHTPADHYSINVWEWLDWTTAFQHDASVVSTGWVTFHFSTPFAYNGRDHLMVDFSYDNSNFTSDGLARSTATPLARSLFLRTDSAYGNPLDWLINTPAGTLVARVPNLRLLADQEIPIEPSRVSNFVNGVWTGQVTLRGSGTDIVLRAVDRAGRLGESNPFAVALLRVASIRRDAGTVTLSFQTLAGSRYVVESRSQLEDLWRPVSPELDGTGGLLDFTLAAPAGQQFYQIRLVP